MALQESKKDKKEKTQLGFPPDMIITPAIDTLPPKVAILWFQECCLQIFNLAMPNPDEGASPVKTAILVKPLHLVVTDDVIFWNNDLNLVAFVLDCPS